MAEKILNTRILLKYDILGKVSDIESEKGWVGHNPKLLKGEVAVVAVESAPTKDVNSVAAPQILFKVGDGTHKFNELPWATGLAADVYGWAKKSAPDIEDFKSILPADTNTTYKIEAISSKPGSYKFYSKEKDGSWDAGVEFGVDENAIKELITTAQTKADDAYTLAEGKADKTAAIGAVEAVSGRADQIAVKTVSNTSKSTITINNVAEAGHATKATQDNSGNVITSTYATKTELSTKVSDLEKLINPGMEFKGVLNITALTGLPTTGVKKGDTYKLGKAFSTYKAGDAIIAIKDAPAQIIDDTTNWSLIPAGDDIEDTWRAININGNSFKGSEISTGPVNFKNGSNITITSSGNDITISASDSFEHPAGNAANKAEGFYKISTDATSHVNSTTAVTAKDITDTLGYTPYNATNPNGYTSNKGTLTQVNAGKGLTGGGVGSNGVVTVDVGKGTGITINENDIAVTDYNNILTHKGGSGLQDEAGNTIIFCCGNSNC